VFVELGEGLEGLCHISELAEGRVERAEDVAQLGQDMDFKILRIEHDNQKIGLSHRAVGKDEEPHVDTKMYSTEAKGGMASLAELANVKLGSASAEPPDTKKAKEKSAAADSSASAEPAGEEGDAVGASQHPGTDKTEADEAPSMEGASTEPEQPAEVEQSVAEEPAAEQAAPEQAAPESPENTAAGDQPAQESEQQSA
jgi:small subunit ribosomal protein S1